MEIVGSEAPHVHRHAGIFGEISHRSVGKNMYQLAILALDAMALGDVGEIALLIDLAISARHTAILTQCIADIETYHAVSIALAGH